MQNWDSLPPATYEHNWYGNMFPIKAEPQSSPLTMDHYVNMKQTQAIDMSSLTPSPRVEGSDGHNFFDNGMPVSNHHPLGFNPLTPPGLPNAIIPTMNFHHEISQDQQNHSQQSQDNMSKIDSNSLTPRNTPPMDVTPPKSPKIFNDIADKDNELTSNSSEDTRFLESEDDESIRVPIYNSHGKMKNYKCKHCGFLAITKVSFWNHVRGHMKPEKILQCPKCPFVTELKHHLEYHIRKHKNLKPFQCDKCNYSCVNKSMLNSHLKSHSSIYQYRCADCDYATKYCHSFKLHLRKYEHKPGVVLDEDGSPNPSVVIDVYGTRRGPKMKGNSARLGKGIKQEVKLPPQPPPHLPPQAPCPREAPSPVKSQIGPLLMGQNPNVISSLLPNTLANMLQQSRNMSFFPYLNLNLQMIAAQQQAVLAQLSPRMREATLQSFNSGSEQDELKDEKAEPDDDDADRKSETSAMDLSQTTPTKSNPESEGFKTSVPLKGVEDTNTPTITSSSSSRRKGRVLKLDATLINNAEDTVMKNSDANDVNDSIKEKSYSNESPSSSIDGQKFTTPPEPSKDGDSNSAQNSSQISGIFECKYCDIYFKDAVLYTIHMGYHSCDDVFKCNMCGEKCDGPVGLFVHMARNAHS